MYVCMYVCIHIYIYIYTHTDVDVDIGINGIVVHKEISLEIVRDCERTYLRSVRQDGFLNRKPQTLSKTGGLLNSQTPNPKP